MMIPALMEIYERDLKKLADEINLYADEKQLWLVSGSVTNSPGNLCLHLIGNLNHFIGAALGNTGFVRERDKEFSESNIARDILIEQIRLTSMMVKSTLQQLTENDLSKEYPLELAGRKLPTSFLLMHLTTHLSYHLGQINYHRRMIS